MDNFPVMGLTLKHPNFLSRMVEAQHIPTWWSLLVRCPAMGDAVMSYSRSALGFQDSPKSCAGRFDGLGDEVLDLGLEVHQVPRRMAYGLSARCDSGIEVDVAGRAGALLRYRAPHRLIGIRFKRRAQRAELSRAQEARWRIACSKGSWRRQLRGALSGRVTA